ncbi:hypothetical protein pb186bvf_020807 [Paramecium bursaria]
MVIKQQQKREFLRKTLLFSQQNMMRQFLFILILIEQGLVMHNQQLYTNRTRITIYQVKLRQFQKSYIKKPCFLILVEQIILSKNFSRKFNQINMNQKINQKERNLQKQQKIYEIATNLLKHRACLLINNADYAVHKKIQCQKMWTSYQEIIETFQDQPIRTQFFRLHVLVGGTRSWEGLSLDENKEKRFQINQTKLLDRINIEFCANHRIMSEQVDIEKIPNDHPLILAAKNNILRNHQIAIEKFFTKTKFYSYSFRHVQIQKSYGQESKLKQESLDIEMKQQEEPSEQIKVNKDQQGFLLINKILFDNAVKQLHLLETLEPLGNNNSEYDNLSDLYKALVTLEHEGLHGLIRFVMNNENPQLISPEKNDELRIDGEMQEAGNYYAFKAYGIKADVSPFCLNVQQLK